MKRGVRHRPSLEVKGVNNTASLIMQRCLVPIQNRIATGRYTNNWDRIAVSCNTSNWLSYNIAYCNFHSNVSQKSESVSITVAVSDFPPTHQLSSSRLSENRGRLGQHVEVTLDVGI